MKSLIKKKVTRHLCMMEGGVTHPEIQVCWEYHRLALLSSLLTCPLLHSSDRNNMHLGVGGLGQELHRSVRTPGDGIGQRGDSWQCDNHEGMNLGQEAAPWCWGSERSEDWIRGWTSKQGNHQESKSIFRQ